LFPDAILTLDKLYNATELKSLMSGIEGISQAEGWAFQTALYVEKDAKSTKKVLLQGAPEGSSMFDEKALAQKLQAGHLLNNTCTNDIVISNHLLSFYPAIKLGDSITLKINQKSYDFKIVGIISMFGQPESPTLFVNYAYLNQILEGKDKVRELRIDTTGLSDKDLTALMYSVETALNKAGIQIREVNLGNEMFEEFSLSTNIVIALLIVLSVFMLIVGTIGLAGSLNISVLERTSEFGIMRSIGGSHKQINRFILLEGMIITGIAWSIGNLLSLPITYFLSGLLGNALFATTASFQVNLPGVAIGFVIAFVMTLISCSIPCRNLSKLVTRDMLVYE
jgi:ABC-type antimicrobial peptide transport system permease subunit